MSYTKQTHVAGQKLTAAQLNYMENGIMTAQNVYNLLDNSDFSNPVAQAGFNGLHGSKKYVCDRWISWNVDAVFENGYMTTGSPYDQLIEPAKIDIAKTYTAAIGLADGNIIAYSGNFANGFGFKASGIFGGLSSDNTTPFVRIASGQNVRWAALYEGSYTAETLPAYVPKGYGVELAECQRYLRVLPELTLIFSSVLQNGMYNTNTIYFDRLRDNITPSVSWLDYFPEGGTGAFGIVQGVSYVTINDVTAMVYPDRIYFTTTKSYGGHAFEIKRCLLSAEL